MFNIIFWIVFVVVIAFILFKNARNFFSPKSYKLVRNMLRVFLAITAGSGLYCWYQAHNGIYPPDWMLYIWHSSVIALPFIAIALFIQWFVINRRTAA